MNFKARRVSLTKLWLERERGGERERDGRGGTRSLPFPIRVHFMIKRKLLKLPPRTCVNTRTCIACLLFTEARLGIAKFDRRRVIFASFRIKFHVTALPTPLISHIKANPHRTLCCVLNVLLHMFIRARVVSPSLEKRVEYILKRLKLHERKQIIGEVTDEKRVSPRTVDIGLLMV